MICDGCTHAENCPAKAEHGGAKRCSAFKPITEQEYLQTCNTEQLADVFFDYRYVNATPRQKLWMSASEECIKADIVEWLKQPYKDGES